MDEQQTPAPAEAGDEAVVTEEVTQAEQATTEESENTQGQEQDQPAEGKPEEPSPSKQRRERRKAREAAEREERQQLERKVETLEAQLAEYEVADAPPKESDYKSFDDYEAAKLEYYSGRAFDKRERGRLEREHKEAEAQQAALDQRREAQRVESWQEQSAEARTRYADFDKVVGDPNLPITDAMVDVFTSSENGADIAYHLGKNPVLTAQIAQMPPLEQAMQLGIIQAQLQRPQPNKISNAPEPPSPVTGRATATKDPGKMTPSQYREWRASGGQP